MDNQLINLGLTEKSGKAFVSSRDIARVFEKRHDHVLRDIREIIERDPVWGVSNFGETPYKRADTKRQLLWLCRYQGYC